MHTAVFWLFIVVDLLGAAGAVLVTVPLLREFGLKRLINVPRTRPPIEGLERASEAAQTTAAAELIRFKPEDGAYVVWGLVVIASSYLLHIVAEVLDHLSP